jgi:hypothetical protein
MALMRPRHPDHRLPHRESRGHHRVPAAGDPLTQGSATEADATVEDQEIWQAELDFDSAGRSPDALETAYRELDEAGAERLALRAVDALERAPGQREIAMEVLTRVACFVPAALTGLHGRLLDADILSDSGYPYNMGLVFVTADGVSRDRLVAIVDRTEDGEVGRNALRALSWLGDDEVRRRLRAWRERPPGWVERDTSVDWFALYAGWEPQPDGGRRELGTLACRRLERAAPPGPVVVVAEDDGSCAWCGGRLTTLLDIDLRDSRMGFLGFGGRRLRVVTCERCTSYGPVYTDVDLDGGARWSDDNRRPEYLPDADELDDWIYLPSRQLGLGGERRTPFEAMAFESHMSQLGGCATWIQNPDFPVCLRCERRMPFVAQVDGADFDDFEGMIYAFFDPACGVVATCYQQT